MRRRNVCLFGLFASLALPSCTPNSPNVSSSNPSIEQSEQSVISSQEESKQEETSSIFSSEEETTYALKINTVKDFSTSFQVNGEAVTEAKEGDEVHLLISSHSAENRFKELKNDEGIAFHEIKRGEEYSFNMPKHEVNIILITEAIPSHNIQVISNEGVDVHLSSNGKEITKGKEGTPVSVSLTFLDSYSFSSIHLYGADLETVEEGKIYSFIMPASDVELVVRSNASVKKHGILSLETISQTSDVFKELTHISQGSQIEEGDEVRFSFLFSASGYEPHVLINGEKKGEITFAKEEKGTRYTCSFLMPKEDVCIQLVQANIQDENGVSFQVNGDTNSFKLLDLSNGKYDVKDSLGLFFLLKMEKGYRLKNLTYERDGVQTVISLSDLEDAQYKVFIPATDTKQIVLNVETKEVGEYDISLANIEHVQVSGNLKGITAGEEVILNVTPKDGYLIKKVNFQTPDKDFAGLTFVDNVIKFKMPNANITLSFDVSNGASLSFTENTGVASVTFYQSSSLAGDPIQMAKAGDTVFVLVKLKDQYSLDKAFLNGNAITSNIYKRSDSEVYFSFIAEDNQNLISFQTTYSGTYTINYQSSGEGYSSLKVKTAKYNWKAGKPISVGLTLMDGYTLKTDDSGKTIGFYYILEGTTEHVIIDKNGSNYSFTMPSGNIALYVETVKNA